MINYSLHTENTKQHDSSSDGRAVFDGCLITPAAIAQTGAHTVAFDDHAVEVVFLSASVKRRIHCTAITKSHTVVQGFRIIKNDAQALPAYLVSFNATGP